MIGTYCGLCGKTGNLTRTECCGRTICWDVDKYVPISFSRVSCYRNHDRYTLCAHHKNEGHAADIDWPNCFECRSDYDCVETYVGYGTSNCNFAEDHLDAVPTFEYSYCCRCGCLIKVNWDGYSRHVDGKKVCSNCEYVPKGQINQWLIWTSLVRDGGTVAYFGFQMSPPDPPRSNMFFNLVYYIIY